MNEIVAIGDLRRGMFVAELDRPWLGTPFLLQGFLIEDDEQIVELGRICQFVYVDRTRSVGAHFAAKPVDKPDPAVKRAPVVRTVKLMRPGKEKLPDFFEVLRVIRAENEKRQVDRHALSRSPVAGIAMRETRLDGRPVMKDQASSGETASEIRDRMREDRERVDDSSGLFDYAASWMKPFTDWFRGGSPEVDLQVARRIAEREKAGQASDSGAIVIYEDQAELEEEVLRASPLYEEAQSTVDSLIHDLEGQRAPDLEKVRASVGGLVTSVVRNPDALIWLNRLKRTDQYSYDHALDVSVLLMVVGRHIGLPEMHLTMLGTAGLMQDLGKIGLPSDLLRKTGELTPMEFEQFKTHVARSLVILDSNSEVSLDLFDIVEKHHERVDGSGYPHGLSGGEIGLFAEMAGMADTYCAMTRDTSYRNAFTNQQALERINQLRDTKFSANVVDQFVQCIGLYPVGTLVELNTGEVAVVISQNRVRRMKPKVMVLLSEDKSPNRYPPTLDLLYDPSAPDGSTYHIKKALAPNAYGIDPSEFYLS
ncbi:MAG: HD-GYP domain-containing protein [Candidatus Methylophosphatis roskildensis]